MREEVFESLLLARPSAKIAEPGGAKKVRGSGPEAPKMKKRRFDWTFLIGIPKKVISSQFLAFFDPSENPAAAADPRGLPPPQDLHETAVFDKKTRFRLGNSQVFETLVRRIP